MKKNFTKVQNINNKTIWKRNTFIKPSFQLKKPKRLFCYNNGEKYISRFSPKQKAKNIAYQGEIRHKVERSKRRKINTPKKISFNSFKRNYSSPYFVNNRRFLNQKKKNIISRNSNLSPFLQKRSTAQQANFRKYVFFFKKKAWYRDKAAPIPGGNQKLSLGFVQKQKFSKKIRRAYLLFKTYQTFNKKAMNKQYRKRAKSNFKQGNLTEFSILMHIDSLFGICSCKRSFMFNPKRASHFYFLNGKYVTKKVFFLYRRNKAFQKDGDFCSNLESMAFSFFSILQFSLFINFFFFFIYIIYGTPCKQ